MNFFFLHFFLTLCFLFPFDTFYVSSSSLLRKSYEGSEGEKEFVSPSVAIESFVKATTLWHLATDPLIVERAGRVLGAMMSAHKDSPNACVAQCCGGIPGNVASMILLKTSIENMTVVLGPIVVAKAKECMNTLQSGRQILKGVVDYPAGTGDDSSDVISIEERTDFMNLNKRPSPVPVGSVIEVMPCYHPVMAVSVEDFQVTNIFMKSKYLSYSTFYYNTFVPY